MADLSSMAKYFASLTDDALLQEYAKGRASYSSDEAWAVVLEEVQGRGILPPAGAMHSTEGVFQSMAWARALPDSDLLRLVNLGRGPHPPSTWALITTELGRRGLTVPQVAPADPSAEAALAATMDTVLAAQEEKSKESDGALAMWVFLGTAVVTLIGLGKLFSLGALIYLVVGAFLSAIVYGLVAFGLRKLVLEALVSNAASTSDSTVARIGIGLFLLDIALALIATRWLTLALFS